MCVNEIKGSVSELGILSLRKCWPKVAPPERLIFPKKNMPVPGWRALWGNILGTISMFWVLGGTQASFDLGSGKFCWREEALHGNLWDKASRYELGLVWKRTWQHLKFGRIMQAAGSPSRKYENNSFNFFLWASQNTDLFWRRLCLSAFPPT